MPPRLLPTLLIVGLALTSLAAQQKKPWLTAAPDPEVTTYYVGLLTKGPNAGTGMKAERKKTLTEQTAYINRLAKEGKLLVSGPFVDNGDWQGIYIYKCDSLEEARELAASDPEVKAGRLKIEVHPWQTAKGSILDPEFARPR